MSTCKKFKILKRKLRLELYSACAAALLLAIVIIFTATRSLLAETEQFKIPNANLVGRLPQPDARLTNGQGIGGFDEELINLVIPELRNYVRDGQFSGPAFQSLPFTLETGLKCCQTFEESLSVTETGLLNQVPGRIDAYLFSNDAEQAATTGAIGHGALWNIQAIWSKQNYLESAIRIRYIRNNSVFREISGNYALIFPRQFNAEDKTEQVFRELIQINNPQLVKGFNWLRFRFYSDAEDVIFMNSPVIKKVRELTGSNTSDALLSSSVALDDLPVWSQKVNSVEVLSYAEDTFLVPLVIANTGPATGLKDSECRQLTNSEFDNREQATWSYQARRFPGSAAWLLNQAVYIPRTLLRIFLETRDPYSLYGRQIIYIDKDTGLPIYKIVFDNSGQLWKTVIGNYAFSPRADSNFPFYPYAQVVIDSKTPQITLLEYLTFKTCGPEAAAKELPRFAPAQLTSE